MNDLVITNISIYKAIVEEAHQKMCELIDGSRRPKQDGSAGWVITYIGGHNTSFDGDKYDVPRIFR